ncbi:MAG: hypothetical protein NHF87_01040 [Candidatus Shikimatogenerans bostrichidophilus]|nr:MAG: hypothetical protein NHF87_01040 [Candidatus Shikimatogenerans bostrichidophilus]
MYSIKKQLEYIYSIHIFEKKIKDFKEELKFIPNLKIKKSYKIYKKKFLKYKNKYKKYINLKNFFKKKSIKNYNLSKKYSRQKKFVTTFKDLIKLNEQIKYAILKYKLSKKRIKFCNKKIFSFLKRKKKNKNKFLKFYKGIKKKKTINSKIKNDIRKKISNIKKELKSYIKRIKKYNIYKNYIYIKKKSKDNIGILSIYKNRSVENVYLTIPKYKYYKLCRRKKILYDYYTGKILIDDIFSKKIKNKINNKLINN